MHINIRKAENGFILNTYEEGGYAGSSAVVTTAMDRNYVFATASEVVAKINEVLNVVPPSVVDPSVTASTTTE